MRINIPKNVNSVISALEVNGFEAFIVGGCVRDTLLNKVPYDYDITTNASPEQMLDSLKSFKVVETGIKHGTITVFIDGDGIEITTYRIDGEYSDHRRPENVTFTTSLREDLARRDFTINALAYSEKTGLVDFFSGQEDLKNQLIRCVGEPSKRFSEDALRIMRALRFSATLGFDVEEETSRAIFLCKSTLKDISAERISAELDKLIMGENCRSVLINYAHVFAEIIPELTDCIGFDQRNKYHKYDVWEHIAVAVSASKRDRIIRLTMFLHDIEKPKCFSFDDKGQGHCFGHQKLSAIKAEGILRRLRYDTETIKRVCLLIEHHDFTPVNEEKAIKKMLNKIGDDAFFQLLDVQRADAHAKNDFCLERLAVLDEIEASAIQIITRGDCLTLKGLSINGDDLVNMGYKGKEIGDILNKALGQVLSGEVPNDREILLTILRNMV